MTHVRLILEKQFGFVFAVGGSLDTYEAGTNKAICEFIGGDIFPSFRPETDGIYTLSLHNLGTDQVKFGGIFG